MSADGRAEVQRVFRPVDGEGQRITIGAASARSTALTIGKEHQYFATKLCWLAIGNNAVNATANTSFPVPAGTVYRYTPRGSNDQYIAVIEDADSAAITGRLFIGQAEQ